MPEQKIPCALFVSDFTDPDVLIHQILKGPVFPNTVEIDDNVKGFPWRITTKYYNATVNLCPIRSNIHLSENLLELTEALVLYFDSETLESFDNIKEWVSKIKDSLPEILLLVCDSFKYNNSDRVTPSAASDWCLKNGFELIVLNDNENRDNDDNDYEIIPEKSGIERVVEALHTHRWPNLEMKSTSCMNGAQTNGHSGIKDGEDDSEFNNLFSKLYTMKESISSLSVRDRRACAEQVVSSFWNAIGGDSDEIEVEEMCQS